MRPRDDAQRAGVPAQRVQVEHHLEPVRLHLLREPAAVRVPVVVGQDCRSPTCPRTPPTARHRRAGRRPPGRCGRRRPGRRALGLRSTNGDSQTTSPSPGAWPRTSAHTDSISPSAASTSAGPRAPRRTTTPSASNCATSPADRNRGAWVSDDGECLTRPAPAEWPAALDRSRLVARPSLALRPRHEPRDRSIRGDPIRRRPGRGDPRAGPPRSARRRDRGPAPHTPFSTTAFWCSATRLISEADQVRFTGYFGNPVEHVRRQPDRPVKEIFLISNIEENGQPIGALGHGELSFHSDLSYLRRPGTLSLLYAVEVPDEGGSTQWCNGYAAYEALDDDLRTWVARPPRHPSPPGRGAEPTRAR